MLRKAKPSFYAIACVLVAVSTVAVARLTNTDASAATIQPFTNSFGDYIWGDYLLVGNQVLRCPTSSDLDVDDVDQDGDTAETLGAAVEWAFFDECAAESNSNDVAVQPNDERWRVYSNVDTSNSVIFNSSSAEVTVPPGATIRFAKLVWSGNTTEATDPTGWIDPVTKEAMGPEPWASCNITQTQMAVLSYGTPSGIAPIATIQTRFRAAARPVPLGTMKLRIDDGTGSASYADITSTDTQVGPQSVSGQQYKSQADVTQQFQDAVAQYGTGVPLTLTGANIPTGEGFNCAGGWSVAVVYEYPERDATYAPDYRFVQIADGFSNIAAADPPEDFTLTPFVASQGTVEPRFGVVAYEGDQAIAGDALLFEGVNVIEPRIVGDPTNNFWVGTIGDYSTRNSWLGPRTPSVPNNEGWEAKVVPFDTGIINGTMNELTGQFRTAGDQYAVDQFLFSATISVLTGTVYEDLDGDGTRDVGEPGIEGVTMTLTGTDSTGAPVDMVAVTDAYGNYYFENLMPSDTTGYTLTETQPTGYFDGAETVGTAGGADGTTAGTDQITGIMHDGTQASIEYLFGDVKPANISGTVYLDPDSDPTTDNSTGIGGVEIRLTGTDVNGLSVDQTVTTNADGTYEFLNLVAGTYTVTETQPTQYADSIDVAGSAGGLNDTNDVIAQIVLGSETSATGYDFIENGGSLSGLVYEDLNGNGAYDTGEPGIGGVTVMLENSGGTTTEGITNPDGTYTFIGLAQDTYTVTETQPAGYGDAAETVGSGGGVSDTNDVISQITVGAGESVDGYLFGEVQPATLGDHVFLDLDGDGFQDVGEPGIPGVSVMYDGSSPTSDTTDAAGNYLLEGLDPGDGTVTFTVPDGYVASPVDAVTGDDENDSDGTTVSTVLTSGDAITNVDLGLVGTGSIGDTLYYDLDGDGIVDPGEPTLPAGVTVTATWYGWDGAPGGGDDIVFTTETDAAGQYAFTMLPPGEYLVVVDTTDPEFPTGFQPISDLDGIGSPNETNVVLGDDPSTPEIETEPMQLGEVDFGYTGTGSIGQTVYFDIDGDGTQDPGETGLSGVDVTLIWYGFDGVVGGGDDVMLTTTTGVDGSYLFDELPAGSYRIVVDSGDVGDGLTVNSADPDSATASESLLTLGAGEINLDQNFGYTGTGELGDRVILDLDGDGIDTSDLGIANVDVTATWAGPDGVFGTPDDVVYTTQTDATGNYLFSNLPAGDFTVAIDSADLPAGVTSTVDPDGTGDPYVWSGSLTTGESLLNVDFAVTGTGTIGDLVWLDLDADGAFSTGDLGLSGIPVSAIWAGPDGVLGTSDDVTYTTTTDVNGNYTFENLPAGPYEVTVDLANAPEGTAVTQDPDSSGETNQWIGDLAAGATIDTVDFALGGSGSIGDQLYMDVDGDGVFDSTDVGLSGVEVTLTWAGLDGVLGTADDVVQTQMTATDGTYVFTNLPAGDFTVSFDLSDPAIPAGLVTVTGDPDGGADGTAAVTLTSGQVNDTTDFGVTGVGVVGDVVWLDVDGDGVLDSGEPGLGGVGVVVTWFGPDGVLGSSDDVVYSVVTDSAGVWSVGLLPAGSFEVVVDSSSVGFPDGVAPTFDADGVDTPLVSVVVIDDVSVPELGQDFGVVGTAGLSGSVFFDVDGDGVNDVSDAGLVGVDVTLTWFGADGVVGGGDDVVFTAVTAADGSYSFANVPAGPVSVVIDSSDLPAGVVSSLDPDGTGDAFEFVGVVPAGEVVTDVDFGVTGTGSIGDQVVWDVAGDGVLDPTDPGLGGVGVEVTWAGPDGVFGTVDDVLYSVVTDANGVWVVPNLPAGSFEVVVDTGTLPAGLESASLVPAGTVDGVTTVVLGDGEVNDTVDYGFAGVGSVVQTVFLDQDADGVRDELEPGFAGVTVMVTAPGADGVFGTADDVVFTTVTDANGDYSVGGLPFGDVQVSVDSSTLPGGVHPVSDADGVDTASVAIVTVVDGLTPAVADFGYLGNTLVGDQVVFDVDGDGTIGVGDVPLAGVGITVLWWGLDGEAGTADDATWTTVTDENGLWSVDGLPEGNVTATIDPATVPAGTVVSIDSDGTPDGTLTFPIVADTPTVLTFDFGVTGTGSISQVTWEDVDGDGVKDPDEATVAGVEFTLTWAGSDGVFGTADDIVFDAATDADGLVEFGNLPPGEYLLEADPATVPEGMSFSLPLGDADKWEGSLGLAEVLNFETAVRLPLADLEITKTLQGELVDGETAAYVIDVVNNGPGVAAGPVSIIDELPAGLTFVSAAGDDVTCDGGATIRCATSGDMLAGDSVSIEIRATVDAEPGTMITNEATVAAGDGLPDLNPANDTDDAAGTVKAVPTSTTAPPADHPPKANNATTNKAPKSSPPSALASTGARIGILSVALLLVGLGLPLIGKKKRRTR